MNRFKYILPLVISALLACGEGGEGASEEDAVEAISGTSTDLSEYGMPYSITVPDGNSDIMFSRTSDSFIRNIPETRPMKEHVKIIEELKNKLDIS